MPNKGLNALAPWLALLIAVAGWIYSLGIQANRIDTLETQMTEVRAGRAKQDDKLDVITRAVIKIETKLEILLPTASGPPKEKH